MLVWRSARRAVLDFGVWFFFSFLGLMGVLAGGIGRSACPSGVVLLLL